MSDALRDFENSEETLDLSEAVESICSYPGSLTDEQTFSLWRVLQSRSGEKVEYGPDFDIRDEVEMQIMAVRAMRNSVLSNTGQIRPGIPAREVKEVVTASNTLLQTLMKTHSKVLSYDRQRAIEEATVETMKALPDEERATFFSLLEANLAAIE